MLIHPWQKLQPQVFLNDNIIILFALKKKFFSKHSQNWIHIFIKGHFCIKTLRKILNYYKMKQGFNITKCERNYVIFPDALYVSGNECVFVLMFSCFPSLLWPLTWARHLCPHNCCLLFTFLSLTLDILRKSLEAEWALSEIFRTTWHHQTKDTKFKDTKMTLFHKVCLHCPLEEQLFCRIENFKQVVLVFKYRLGRNVLFKKINWKM